MEVIIKLNYYRLFYTIILFFCLFMSQVNITSRIEAQELHDLIDQLADYYVSQERRLPEKLSYLSTLEIDTTIKKYIKEGIYIHYDESNTIIINKSVQKHDIEREIYGPGYPRRIYRYAQFTIA